MKKYLPLLIIFILSLSLRLILLDRIPIGISDDELDYVLNAKAVFLTGRDITGTWSPFSLSTPPLEYPKAELPYLIVSPIIGLLNLSLFSARLPYAIFSVLLVILLYLITKKIINTKAAFLVGLIAAINPWSIYFGRTSFDAPLAIFFYFFSFYILLIVKGWKILLVLPFLILAFYCYIGTKILFLPFLFLIELYAWREVNKKRYLKQYVTLFIAGIILVLFFLSPLNPSQSSKRISELLSLNDVKIQQQVNRERRMSIQTPLTSFLSNKLTVLLKESVDKYFGIFSTGFLFLYGDGRSTFSVWNHGVFYYIDFLFILLGMFAIYTKNKKTGLLFTALLLISPLPSVVSNVGVSYSIRSSLIFPIFIIIIGTGISYLLEIVRNRFYKNIISIALIFIYSLLVINFLNIYFFRNPIYNSEGFGFSGRILSKYLDLAEKKDKSVLVITSDNKDSIPTLFKQYLFYTNNYNKTTSSQIAENINKKLFKYKNINFIECQKKEKEKNSTIIISNGSRCELVNDKAKNLSISQLSDGGEIYKIYDDKVCANYHLKQYPHNIMLGDLNIESLSEKQFCEQFITSFY